MNLLVLTSRFPHAGDSISSSFVKKQIDSIKGRDFFDRIYIISLNPFVPKILSNFSFMNPRWKRDALATDYSYDNVEVYFAKYILLPFNFSRKNGGHRALKAANRIITNKRIDFDLIHAHFTSPSGYVGANLKKTYNKPFVLTVHEASDWFLREIQSEDEKLIQTWMMADRIICVNNKELNELNKFNIDSHKLLYVPNGFDPCYFKPYDKISAQKKLGIPADKRIILNIAALEEYKGQKYLIQAMKAVLASRTDVMLYIVGQGSLKKYLQSIINRYDLQDYVVLAGGNKPINEIALWMNACDAFILPSLSESFGIVQIEAMACGKPVVATRNGGSEEIVIDDKLGILVEPRDSEGLARAIFTVLNEEWDQKHILECAKKFTWDRITNKLMRTYSEILKTDLFGD